MRIQNKTLFLSLAGATLFLVANACNNNSGSNGTATVTGTVQGQALSAKSAVFYTGAKTNVQDANGTVVNPNATANGNTTVGDANTVGNSNTVSNSNSVVGNSNAFPVVLQVVNQSGVCDSAQSGDQQAGATSLVLNLTSNQAGVYTVVTGASTKQMDGPVVNGNTIAGNANSILGDANSIIAGNANAIAGDANSIVSSATKQARATFTVESNQCSATTTSGATGGTVTVTSDDNGQLGGSFSLTFAQGDKLEGTFSAAECAAASQNLTCK